MAGLSRRDLIVGWLLRSAPEPEPEPEWEPPSYLRPPGARSEHDLVERCDGCADCASACPHGAIVMLGEVYDSPGTPAVFPEAAPCRLCEDLPCASACATGALTGVAVDSVRMGIARFDPAPCWAAMGQPCDYCVTACPVSPPALSVNGGDVTVDPDRCTGCGLCEFYCTATPRAITVGGRS